MYASLSVGMWSLASGNSTTCMDLDKFLYTNPYLTKEGFGAVLTPASSPPWAWGAWNSNSEEHKFENCFQIKQKMLSSLQIFKGEVKNIQKFA